MKANKLNNFLSQKSQTILWLMIIVYFVVFSLICTWKYFNFGYNGLDLAIFNQVFYNSSQGNLFGLTIHPPSYLGDHFALIIILLLPFYYLWQHPISLLVLQSLVLALSAWPLYLIVKKILPVTWALFIVSAWLFNPFVQNINIFEFHLLPFAIFLLFWTFYFYQQKNFPAFLVFSFLSLLVREDVALVVFMFSILALINKRSKNWIIFPAILSIGWFILATFITSSITPTGSYKFLYYYSWLGGSLGEIFTNVLSNPLLILYRFFSLNNLIFILALLLPFAFIFFEIPFLLLGILIFLQLSLGGSNNSLIVLKTHYSSLLLPSLFIAYIYGLAKFLQQKYSKLSKLKNYLFKERLLFVMIILATVIYSCLALGPLPTVVKQLFKPVYSKEVKRLKAGFHQAVPQQNSVAASYEFLTNLSSRPGLYSLHYAYIGKKQFSDIDYQLPVDTQTLLFDFDDLLTYSVQFPNSSQWKEYYPKGDDNFRKIIQQGNYQVTRIADTLVRMDKNVNSDIFLYQTGQELTDIQHLQNIEFDNGLTFLGFSKLSDSNSDIRLLPVSLYFKAKQKLDKDYQLKLIIKNKNGQTVHQKYYALAYGLYPTTEWQIDKVVKINYWFLVPEKLSELDYEVELQIVYLEGFLRLNGLRSAIPEITNEEILEPNIKLTP